MNKKNNGAIHKPIKRTTLKEIEVFLFPHEEKIGGLGGVQLFGAIPAETEDDVARFIAQLKHLFGNPGGVINIKRGEKKCEGIQWVPCRVRECIDGELIEGDLE